MYAELVRIAQAGKTRTVRTDEPEPRFPIPGNEFWVWPALLALAFGFVLVGAGEPDLGPSEARLGLAVGERLGPLGQVYGYWAPDLWPAHVLPGRIVSWLEEWGRPTPGFVRWPVALAGVITGLILARRMTQVMGVRSGLWLGLCWFGSLGVIDHTSSTGLDLIMGLGTVAAIDRLLTRSSDLIAGLWASLAFLTGGWPPLVLIALAIIIIGRQNSGFAIRLVIPPLLTAIAWSIWTLCLAPAAVWAAALTLPLTQRPDWKLALGVLGVGLPWSPFIVLVFNRSLRQAWSPSSRALALGWLQVALAAIIAGTLVPGLAQAARVPALVGILVVVGTCLESAWTGELPLPAHRAFLAVAAGIVGLWLLAVMYGGYLWTLVFPFYRPLGIIVILLSVPILVLSWSFLETANSRRALVTVAIVTVGLKLVHWGYYVPEWDYRFSQGPWGRAIGQWLLPNWPIYTIHEWPADLAFPIGRPLRQLPSPQHLTYQRGQEAKHVLLLESEFEHWPDNAPPITKVATFHDQHGGRRVLARTEGLLTTPSGMIIPANWDHLSE